MFVKSKEKYIFLVKYDMEPTLLTINMGVFKISKERFVEPMLCQYCNSRKIVLSPDVVDSADTAKNFHDIIIGRKTIEELKALLDIKNSVIDIDSI